MIPPGDYVNPQDTVITNILAHNILRFDSTIVNGKGAYSKVLGSIIADPIFGKSHAFVYTQMGLPKNAFTFDGANIKLDSVVLSLNYKGFYGDSSTTQTFRVYRMKEPNFTIDSNYAYNKALQYDQGELLGTVTVAPRTLRDSVGVYGTKEAPQLRVKLSSAFGNLLLQQKSDGAFKNDTTFRDFLKGFAIVPDTSAGSNRNMIYLNLNDASSKLTVFYQNSVDDSLRATFRFNESSSAHANFYIRNYTGSTASNYINTSNPKGDSILFLTSSPGLYTRLTIPGLESFPEVLINKAELVITQITSGQSDMNDVFTEPGSLSLFQFTNGETTKPMFDYNTGEKLLSVNKQIITNFGGIQIAQYSFNLTRYMQLLIKKQETNLDLKMLPFTGGFINVARVKAGGTKQTQYGIKLRIIYTKP
nr:DUF4270 family protein [Chitinophaga nivalis]